MRLSVVEVEARFGTRRLFTSVSFEVAAGQVIAVVGPSGSGKSTLLAIASGLLRADSGEVSVLAGDGAAARTVSPWCAWVPQGAGNLGARTAIDNAMLGGLGSGLGRREARALAMVALDRVDLIDHARARASALSGGELQRLAIARALCLARPFLFADEPTGALDVANTQHVFRLFRKAAGDGSGVVIATHDLSIAEQCDHLVEL